MARETIEGAPALVPMLVIKGTVQTGSEFMPVGSGAEQRMIPNPEKVSFSVGETVLLSPEDAAHMNQAGFVRAPDEAVAEMQTGSWHGALPPGMVRPS